MTDQPISPTCIMTFTGKYVEPLDIDPNDIDIIDVAHALSNLCRFTGHVRKFYSVAEHCVRVALYLERRGESLEIVRHGLMHDAQEAYLVDIPRPLKADPYFGKSYRGAEARLEVAVAERFGLASHRMPNVVRDADIALLAAERFDLLPLNGYWGILDGVERDPVKIEPWTPAKAERRFLTEYRRLFEEA